jgi:hypothetical protein
MSALHCLIERRGQVLRVHDQTSRNGTFFGGRRESVFDLRPGATFTVGSTRLLALNNEMRAVLPTLSFIVGGEDEHEPRASASAAISPSELVVLATSGSNILITGEPGCEQARLAYALHAISLVRDRKLVEIDQVPDTDRPRQREILDQANRSTLVVTIDKKDPVMDGTFLSMLFSRSYQIRVIAIAPFPEKAKAVLGATNVETMSRIALRPLAERSGAILRLLDRLFVEQGASLRASDLAPENQKALATYAWPKNLAELREAAECFALIPHETKGRRAAETAHIATTTFGRWIDAMGVSLPLVRSEGGR